MTVSVDDLLATPPVELTDFKRDRWGRPLIVPADGGNARPYIRASSAAKTVDDTFNLEKWARRNVAFGMAHDTSLVARVLAVGGAPDQWDKAERDQVNTVVEDAARVAKSYKAADIGTAVHKLTEHLDWHREIDAGPYQPDLDAYQTALVTAGIHTHEKWIECRLVCDELEMAGTADRIVQAEPGSLIHKYLDVGIGCLIADIKTGQTVDYGGLNWAAQLAVYANGDLYDVTTDTRPATPVMNLEHGLIIHLPAGQGRCDLYLVDLQAGYQAAALANQIRAVRKAAKGWLTPVEQAPAYFPRTYSNIDAHHQDYSPEVPVELIASTSRLLRGRLGVAVDAGARHVRWPAHVRRFKDGGPQTWVAILEVERVVLDAERDAGVPFPQGLLPVNPTVPPPPTSKPTKEKR